VPNGRTLDSLTSGRAPAWGAAVAEPGERTILLRADQDDLPRTLRHELAHLALHEAVSVRVPLWFDEGYAAWAAGEWERFGGLELNLAVVRGAIPSLTALDGALRGSASTADAAYALAASAVTELARRNPTGTLTPLLQHLEHGDGFDQAVLATTGLTMDRFEDAWRRAVRRRYTWGQWLIAGGGWSVAGVLVLWLVRRRRRVDRARRAALDIGWVVEPETEDGPELDPPPKP
jgi:Peptidase MA superfamily